MTVPYTNPMEYLRPTGHSCYDYRGVSEVPGEQWKSEQCPACGAWMKLKNGRPTCEYCGHEKYKQAMVELPNITIWSGFAMVKGSNGNYRLRPNSITFKGIPIFHSPIDETTSSGVARTLNSIANTACLGTWSANGTADIKLESTCEINPVLPWVTT